MQPLRMRGRDKYVYLSKDDISMSVLSDLSPKNNEKLEISHQFHPNMLIFHPNVPY